MQFGQQLAKLTKRAFTLLRHAAQCQGARGAARPATLHQLFCALGILDDEFVALEAIGRGGDAGQADFGHRRCPLGGLTVRLHPLDAAVGERRCVLGAPADGCAQDGLGEHEVQ